MKTYRIALAAVIMVVGVQSVSASLTMRIDSDNDLFYIEGSDSGNAMNFGMMEGDEYSMQFIHYFTGGESFSTQDIYYNAGGLFEEYGVTIESGTLAYRALS